MAENYYTLLGVDPDASEDAILQAYREKAAKHHPDVSEETDAEATFQRLNQAKNVLTDAERRREYDRMGHDRYVNQSADRTDPAATSDENRREPTPNVDRGDWSSGIGSLFTALFGGIHPRSAGPRDTWVGAGGGGRPYPFTIDLYADFPRAGTTEVSDRPGETETSQSDRSECPKCQGRGRFVHEIDTTRGRTRRVEPCERCGGAGTVPDQA